MSTITITPVEYGKSVLPESMIFVGGSKEKVRPIVFKVFLIRAGERLILVDAGCVTMPGFDMREFIGPIQALKKLQIEPEMITDVIVTHSHHDHVECVSAFKHATVYMQQAEYAAAKRYFEPDIHVQPFDQQVTVCDGVTAINIGGHSTGSCIVEIQKEDGLYVIAGDECYMRECLDKKIPTGTSCNPEKSRAFIEKYSDPRYTVLLCHDE